MSNSVTKRHDFSGCPIKSESRRRLILDPCNYIYGSRIPEQLQYWCLCARCIDSSCQIIKGCELDQMTECGLINSNQFHGVDFDSNTIGHNSLYKNSSWYFDHLEDAISKSIDEDNFNPAVVHVDTTWMTEKASDLLPSVLDIISYSGCNIPIVSFGVVLEAYNRVETSNDLLNRLCDNALFRKVWNQKKWKLWRTGEEIVSWPGTGKISRTIMMGITFIPTGDNIE